MSEMISAAELADIIGADMPASQTAMLLDLAADMDAGGAGRDEPVREVFALIGDRWCTLILMLLKAGPVRHAALRRLINRYSSEGAISQRVLTMKLRALERDGFVFRVESGDAPRRVDYALTPLGAALSDRVTALIAWLGEKRADIETARRAFAAAAARGGK